MYTVFVLLSVPLSIAACIVVPIWMKKKGKGKNAFLRILAGLGSSIALFLLFSIVAAIFWGDKITAATPSDTSTLIEMVDTTVLNVDSITKADTVSTEPAPVKSTSVPTFHDGRCEAITQRGTRCSRKAEPGSIYCWQHKKRY